MFSWPYSKTLSPADVQRGLILGLQFLRNPEGYFGIERCDDTR